MKWPNAPLLERITYVLVQPVSWALHAHYHSRANNINKWYAEAWRWNDDDCNVFFINAKQEDVEAAQEEELEEAYELYVDMCRPFGIVPKPFIDSNKE